MAKRTGTGAVAEVKSRRGRPGVPEEKAKEARAAIQRLLKTAEYSAWGGKKLLAARLQIEAPSLSAFLKGGGMSYETAARLSDLVSGKSPPEPENSSVVRMTLTLVNLEKCIDYHPPGRWMPSTISAARGKAFADDVDPQEWPARLDALEHAIKSAVRSSGVRHKRQS